MELNTLKTDIPFEIHITVDSFSKQSQQLFIDLCLQNEAKPLFIELAKGDHVYQPMLGKIVSCFDIPSALSFANKLSNLLNTNNFPIKRLKIEVPAEYSDAIGYESGFDNYFEWHGKVNYINVDELMQICNNHQAHLSSNSLKNENHLRFITLREFGTRQQFESRIQTIVAALNTGWDIIKQESEYCIYDNNVYLDNGWLPQ